MHGNEYTRPPPTSPPLPHLSLPSKWHRWQVFIVPSKQASLCSMLAFRSRGPFSAGHFAMSLVANFPELGTLPVPTPVLASCSLGEAAAALHREALTPGEAVARAFARGDETD